MELFTITIDFTGTRVAGVIQSGSSGAQAIGGPIIRKRLGQGTGLDWDCGDIAEVAQNVVRRLAQEYRNACDAIVQHERKESGPNLF